MILPTIRASFGRADALHLVELLGRSDPELRSAARARLEEEGVDALLDDPRVLNALLTDRDVHASPGLIFYVLVRQALLEGGVTDPTTADYVASVVVAFGRGDRAWRVSEESDREYHYLIDMIAALVDAPERRAFLLRAHLGNYSLWLTGLFPDFVEGRVRRRGAPPLRYYEEMGSAGFRSASSSREAEGLGVAELFLEMSRSFSEVRVALNRVSDRHLWSGGADPVGSLLREIQRRHGGGPAGDS